MAIYFPPPTPSSGTTRKETKKFWTEKDEGEKVHYFRAEDDKDEASYVAYEVDKLCGRGRKYSDLLCLSYQCAVRLFEEAFRSREFLPDIRRIPVLRPQGSKDMVAYMRLVQNPADDLSLERIINEPKRESDKRRWKSSKCLLRSKTRASSSLDGSGDHARIAGQSGENLYQLAETISRLSQEQDNLKISDIYDVLLVRTGIYKH